MHLKALSASQDTQWQALKCVKLRENSAIIHIINYTVFLPFHIKMSAGKKKNGQAKLDAAFSSFSKLTSAFSVMECRISVCHAKIFIWFNVFKVSLHSKMFCLTFAVQNDVCAECDNNGLFSHTSQKERQFLWCLRMSMILWHHK